ncbi:MAG: winged helix-turn-helix transcriptional regulator [Chloroflexi bacterium]|nr:winged helix-turn-helix transcriptional regulator [Chloroflexota bacterium]
MSDERYDREMPSLVFQIQQASRLFDRMLDSVIAELGVSMTDLPVLIEASRRGGTTVALIRESFGYPGATASLALRRLEAQGYVRSSHDAPDGRIVVIRGTRAGRMAADVARARIAMIEAQIARRSRDTAILACFEVLDAARAVRLPRSLLETRLPRRPRTGRLRTARPQPSTAHPQPSRRPSSARIAASSAGSA